MIKKIVLIALVMFPVISFAQESQKIAFINYDELIAAMPEYKQMMDSLQKKESAYMEEIQLMRDDLTKKYSDYVAKQDSLPESIKIRRQQEIEDLQARAQNFQQHAAQEQDELQQTLAIPIRNKLQKAINEVGAENNFLYIAYANAFLYMSPNATDATPLIKKKLGIQ